jgi:hypothetical protein
MIPLPHMPSHVAHLVFAEETVARVCGTESPLIHTYGNYLALGAQGPDIFFHNQRTMPTGIRYGVLLHRHGYGRFIASLTQGALAKGAGFDSELSAYTAGFLSHAILDRYTHPFINYFAGWVDPEDESSARYRSMHPFLERIIDLHVLGRFRALDINTYDFYSRVNCGGGLPESLEKLLEAALVECYRRARRDEELAQRLRNAYSDTMGYYRYSNRITPGRLREGYRREQEGDIGNRWLAILHPFAIDGSVDYLNELHAAWSDPCDKTRVMAASFWDLMRNALDECTVSLAGLEQCWNGRLPFEKLEELVGNGGLGDTSGAASPCSKRYSRPLPLAQLLQRLRRAIAENDLPESPPVLG